MVKNTRFSTVPLQEEEVVVNAVLTAESVDEEIRTEMDKSTYSARVKNHDVVMVEVIAPSNLSEGFKFMAVHNGVQFPVIVPAGGCIQGERLTVPFKPATGNNIGMWKDDIFACTRYGIFHPSFVNACCCPFILLGQIMTRLRMDWKGDRVGGNEYIKTFRTMLLVELFAFVIFYVDPDDPIHILITVCEGIFLGWLVAKVRRGVREEQNIAPTTCRFEDSVYATTLTLCTISQLARQTADYDSEKARFLAPDGLELSNDRNNGTYHEEVEIV